MAIITLSALKEPLLGWNWPYATILARKIVLGIFSGLETGSLLVVDEVSSTKHVFGQKRSGGGEEHENSIFIVPEVKIAGYMVGDFECDDLTSFFKLFIMNKGRLNGGRTMFSTLSTIISKLGRSTNTLANSLLNTASHYDISNDMFSAFLSKDMTYSCPIWKHDSESLEEAQQTKLLRFISGTRLKATDHVLEIGTGWGSFAIEAVKRTGCRVTSITLSQKQKELAEKRIKLAGLGHRIEVLFMDYRELTTLGKVFDKIVSIEMIEAVGEAHLAQFFGIIHRLLKREGGVAMFQCITIPEALHAADLGKGGFIEQYIFPGGYLPSTMQLLNHISTQSNGSLNLERVENIGGHYAKTLRLWRESFLRNFDGRIAPALLDTHPEMLKETVEVFHRKWEYYFSYCEAGFLTKTLNDVIITVSRAGALELMQGIPL